MPALALGALAVGFIPSAKAARLTLGDPILLPYAVGARFDSRAAEGSGFVMTDTFQLDEHGTRSYVRYENETEDATYFVEASVGDGLIHSLGWSRTLSKSSADSAAAQWLGAFAMRFGFPVDVVADGATHAVAWNDEAAADRLELIEQPEGEGSEWELSAVLRSQPKNAK